MATFYGYQPDVYIASNFYNQNFLLLSTFQTHLITRLNWNFQTHHFTEDIQTRQYRSLEVLLGAGYGPPADIW